MAHTEIVSMGGAALFCDVAGRASATVFLHAGVADRRMWSTCFEVHQSAHRVVAYDRRGFGRTTTPDESFSHVEDLLAVLDALEIDAAALVGCSQGGRIAVDFTLEHPTRVTKLVLMAPAVMGAPPPAELPAEIEAHLDALEAADEAGDLDRVNEAEAQLWLDGPLSPAGRVTGEPRALFLEMNAIALAAPSLTREREAPPAFDRLPSLSVPTLVMCGSLDFPHLVERCAQIARAIPGATSVEIEAAAHLPVMEQPDQVNALLAEFL